VITLEADRGRAGSAPRMRQLQGMDEEKSMNDSEAEQNRAGSQRGDRGAGRAEGGTHFHSRARARKRGRENLRKLICMHHKCELKFGGQPPIITGR